MTVVNNLEGDNEKISKIIKQYTVKMGNYEDKVIECTILKEYSDSISFQLETSLVKNEDLLTALGKLHTIN